MDHKNNKPQSVTTDKLIMLSLGLILKYHKVEIRIKVEMLLSCEDQFVGYSLYKILQFLYL